MKALLLLISLVSLPALAEKAPTPLSEMSVLQMVAPLLLVVVLIFLLAWAIKKINPRHTSMGKDITVLSCTSVSNQARLCLVRVGAKDILIGVTNQQVTHIETFKEPVVEQLQESSASDLSKQFSKLLRPKNKN